MTLSPVLLALCGLLLSALGALLAGGVAWGRFAAVPTSWTQRHRTTYTTALDTMTPGGLFVAVSVDTWAPSTDAILEVLDIRTVEEPVTL